MDGLTFDVGLNTKGFNSGIGSMESALGGLGGAAKKVGGIIAAALGGAAIADAINQSVKAFNEFDKGMANIGTLVGGNQQTMKKWEDQIISVGIETGKSMKVMEDGAYQTISAFGDTAEALEIYEVGAKAATAGVAEVNDTINFLAANMKGFNTEMTKTAAEGFSDLAFTAIKLGQTTMPELANSMGAVIPIANSLGVSEEELYGTMATFTGVTGNTSAVVTQLRGVLAGLASPTEVMAGVLGDIATELAATGQLSGDVAQNFVKQQGVVSSLTSRYDRLNKEKAEWSKLTAAQKKEIRESKDPMKKMIEFTSDEADKLKNLKSQIKSAEEAMEQYAGGLSSAIIESIGFPELLTRISDAAAGNTGMLKEMFGRIEATTLALSAGQIKDTWLEKIQAMYESAGASQDAYLVQAESVAHTFDQFASAAEVAKISVGGLFATMAQPLVQKMTIDVTNVAASLRQATSDFEAWRSELDSIEGFGKKMNFVLNAVATVALNIVDAAGEAIDSLAGYISTEILDMKPDDNKTVDLNDIGVIVAGTLKVIDETFKWAAGSVDKVADLIRKIEGLAPDDNEEVDSGDIGVVVGGILSVTGEAFAWGATAIQDTANFIREKKGLAPDTNPELDIGDIGVVVGGILTPVGEAFTLAGGAVDGVADFIRKKQGLKPDSNPTADIGDVGVIIAGTLSIAGETLKWAGNAIDQLAAMIRSKYPELGYDKQPGSFNVGDIGVIISGALKLTGEKITGIATVGRQIETAIRSKLQGYFAGKETGGAFGNGSSIGVDIVAKVFGSAPLAIPISFILSKTQMQLSALLAGVTGFGSKVKVVGGKVLNAAGSAALSIGISFGLSEAAEGGLSEAALKQGIAAALGISTGVLTGSAATGQLVYGVTVIFSIQIF